MCYIYYILPLLVNLSRHDRLSEGYYELYTYSYRYYLKCRHTNFYNLQLKCDDRTYYTILREPMSSHADYNLQIFFLYTRGCDIRHRCNSKSQYVFIFSTSALIFLNFKRMRD